MGGAKGGMRGRVFRNKYKGRMEKTKGDGIRGGRWGGQGRGGSWDEKAEKYLNNNKLKKNKAN